jgi:hypothetical protein
VSKEKKKGKRDRRKQMKINKHLRGNNSKGERE